MTAAVPRTAARVRFALAAAACGAWAGTIAWLAWTSANPVLVSAPQTLSADAVVVAQLSADGDRLEILRVRWTRRPLPAGAMPKRLSLAGVPLPDKAAAKGVFWAPAAMRPGGWEVAEIPDETPDGLRVGVPRRPVYPDAPGVAAQFDALLPAERQP